MMSFRTNLEAVADSKAKVTIPSEMMEAYFITQFGWGAGFSYRTAPHYIIEQIQFIWHLQDIANKAAERKAK